MAVLSLVFCPTPNFNPSRHHSSLPAAVCAPPMVWHKARSCSSPLRPIQSLPASSCSVVLSLSFRSLEVSQLQRQNELVLLLFFHKLASPIGFIPLNQFCLPLQRDRLPCKSKCSLGGQQITSRGKTCGLCHVLSQHCLPLRGCSIQSGLVTHPVDATTRYCQGTDADRANSGSSHGGKKELNLLFFLLDGVQVKQGVCMESKKRAALKCS